MRYVVLILALLGVVATGALGFKGFQAANDPENKRALESNRALASKNPLAKALVEKEEKRVLAVYCLLGTAVLGLAGGILAFVRKKFIAAPLLLLPGIAPVVVVMGSDKDAGMGAAIFCSPLFLAGLLSFLIKAKPKTASAEEEEEEQPKRGGKRGRAVVDEVEEPAHAEEEAEAAFAALEMEGVEDEAAPAKPGKTQAEDEADLEAAVAEEEEHVDLEAAAAPEEETSDHEPVAAVADEEEAAATLFEQEKPAAPRRIDKFVCPSCDTFLKASAPLPVGKPFNCPKCREAVTVTARG